MEYVADKAGAAYYNNSKATNSKATSMALASFRKPVVLIAGGLDRGSDYMELLPVLGGVKALVALGQTKDKLAAVAGMAGVKRIISVDNGESAAAVLQEAVREASALAEAGDIVLLSPACASWDMFTSYEERGRIFKEAVHNL
ncbi:UDP-N-acetylmuramoylalanine--D-glutamate ligase [compost metagenome]